MANCSYEPVWPLLQVADQVVSQHGSDGAVHWLDHGTEHPHRIALSVRSDKVQMCMRQLSEGLKAHGVQVGCLRRDSAEVTTEWMRHGP